MSRSTRSQRTPLPALAGLGAAMVALACLGGAALLVAALVDEAGRQVGDHGRGVGVALLGLPVAAVLALFAGIGAAGRVRTRMFPNPR
ncbi:hypothetical protein [Pseudonocardia sp. GCM10023141]|uniref:hypothetical protein n=1 Tax=Pseudonocardia sp. GCM10023141 TaxID=3252653 RepID=UPI003617043B